MDQIREYCPPAEIKQITFAGSAPPVINMGSYPVEQQVLTSRQRTNLGVLACWRWPAILISICAALALASFRHTVQEMVHIWGTSRTYSHCFLIVPLFAYLVWIRRKQILAVRPDGSFWGLILLACSAAVWLAGNLGDANVVQEFALVAMLAALVWALLGTRVLRVAAFPLFFLFFAVPFGVSLVSPLQDFTAWFAVQGLTLSNVPAVLESRAISLPTSTWTVGEACSGIRYLFASTVVGIFYSSLVYRSRKRQLAFVGASILTPIVANGLRAYGIVLLGYLTDNRLATGVDHLIYGGIFFSAIQIALLTVGFRWREKAPGNAPTTYVPSLSTNAKPTTMMLVAAATITLIIFTPLWAKHLWSRSGADAFLEQPPLIVDSSWMPIRSDDVTWTPKLHGFDRETQQSYQSGENRVDLCLVFYSGHEGTELVASSNRFSDPKLWSLVSQKLDHATVNGHDVTIDKTLIESGPRSRSVWILYWVGGEYTASASQVKLLQAKARLFGTSAVAEVIVLGSDSQFGSPGTGEAALQSFLAHTSFMSSKS